MKVIKITTLVVFAFVTLGCGDGMDAMPDSSSILTVPAQQPVTVNRSEASADTDGLKTAIAPTPSLNSTALNPPHGQPGHRCDILVGKPLNSKPATNAAAVSTPSVNSTGTHFQWVAINTVTGEFFGTGGGTYHFNNGSYQEHIEFFSRDSTRIGMSLTFKDEVKDGVWHHSGTSTKGDPIQETWIRYKP